MRYIGVRQTKNELPRLFPVFSVLASHTRVSPSLQGFMKLLEKKIEKSKPEERQHKTKISQTRCSFRSKRQGACDHCSTRRWFQQHRQAKRYNHHEQSPAHYNLALWPENCKQSFLWVQLNPHSFLPELCSNPFSADAKGPEKRSRREREEKRREEKRREEKRRRKRHEKEGGKNSERKEKTRTNRNKKGKQRRVEGNKNEPSIAEAPSAVDLSM